MKQQTEIPKKNLKTKKKYQKPRIVYKKIIETLAGSCSQGVGCDGINGGV